MFLYASAMLGINDKSHLPPIWFTIFLAVSHATWFASAGSRLDHERKNRRVNVMNTNVWNTAHV